MTPVPIEEDQPEQVELELTEAAATGGSQEDSPQAAPEQTYDSLFPALPMGSTKPARPAATNNATPMVKVTSSRITQVGRMALCSTEGNDRLQGLYTSIRLSRGVPPDGNSMGFAVHLLNNTGPPKDRAAVITAEWGNSTCCCSLVVNYY